MFTLTQLESGSCNVNLPLSKTKPGLFAFQASTSGLAPGGQNNQAEIHLVRPGGNHHGAATKCRVQKVLEIGLCIRFAIWMTSSTEKVNAEVLFFPFNGSRQLRLRDHDLLRSQENQQLSCINSKSTNWSPGLSVPSLILLIILSPVKVLCLSEQ